MYSFDYIKQTNDWWKTVTSFHNFDLFFFERFGMQALNMTYDSSDLKIVKLYSDLVVKYSTLLTPI